MTDKETIELKSPKVFISYAWADELSALAIDQWLRDHGARVLIDRRDFIPGNDIEAEIVRCIRDAGKVVCIYSKNSSNRPYPELERRITAALEKEKSKHRRLIYFCIDDTPLPLEALPRLAIKAANMNFDSACEQLWCAILEESVPPKKIDLEKFKEKAPWQMSKKEQNGYVESIKSLTKTVEDMSKSYDSMYSQDIKRIAELFCDFSFLPTKPYLERVLSVLKREVSQRSNSHSKIREQCEKMAANRKFDPAVFMNMAFLEAQERKILTICQKAIDLIDAGLSYDEPKQLERIRKRVNEMFDIR